MRNYLEKPVERERVERLLAFGAMAPSAMNRQPCRFTVVESRMMLKELSDKVKKLVGVLGVGMRVLEMMKVKEDVVFYNAPLLIVISAPKDDRWSRLDCALAAENMMLAGYAMGLGSCYIGFALSLNDDACILKDLGVPEGHEIVSPLIFGYPRKWPNPKEKKPNVVKWIA